MTRAIKFTKMHGAGNDYIYVDTTQYPISHPEELARAWSAPHTGIGSDGLVLIGSSDKADFSGYSMPTARRPGCAAMQAAASENIFLTTD